MKVSRRSFLKSVALAAVVSGCSQVIDQQTQPGVPSVLQPPGGTERHPIAHLLNRAAYGPRPGQIAEVEAMGRTAWIDRQLDYTSIGEGDVNLRLRRYDTLKMKPRDLLGFERGKNRNIVRDELAVATLIRAVYSERQLYEVMVGFWSDHFSVYTFKEQVAQYKTVDDRAVIRPYALGKFADLLRASAHSPAMLFYLDNVQNLAESVNENYAREIMELHTLGVDGGYTEDDIKEVAKCFTGWTVNGRGEFTFNADQHVVGEKYVLGQVIHSEDAKAEGERVLEILAQHPNTARFVCTKLVRRFIADDPPQDAIAAAVQSWHGTNGDIRAVVRTILLHEWFDNAAPKLKRPLELVISLLRTTSARYDGDDALLQRLDDLGHFPFGWVTPDGYPDTAEEWTGNMLDRWNLCLDAFAGTLPGVYIDLSDLMDPGNITEAVPLNYFGRLFLKRELQSDELQTLQEMHNTHGDLRQTLGMLTASPAFQWR